MHVSSVGERSTSWRCQLQIGELSLFKKAGIKKKMLPVKRNEDLHLNSMPFFFSGSSRIPRLNSLYLFVRYDSGFGPFFGTLE